jgi:hypothetical protein
MSWQYDTISRGEFGLLNILQERFPLVRSLSIHDGNSYDDSDDGDDDDDDNNDNDTPSVEIISYYLTYCKYIFQRCYLSLLCHILCVCSSIMI